MKTLNYFGMIAVVVMAACTTSDAEVAKTDAPTLDGMTFVTDFHEAGSDEISSDTLLFADGTCHSTMCDEFGFSKGNYTVETDGEDLIFTATTTSEVDGKMVWTGRVSGDDIDGDVIWTKEGQGDITYLFKGSTK